MDLLSLTLTLKPLKLPQSPAELPRWWGRAGHSLLLNVIRQQNDLLSAELHAGPGSEETDQPAGNSIRPFTASTLMGRFPNHNLGLEESYILRLTAFRADLVGILVTEATSGLLAAGKTIELDYLPFEIQQNSISMPPSEWSASGSYQELSAPYLLGKTPGPRRISLQLTSPTTFKSAGKHQPMPLPGLVFGSLLERWNAYAPVSFPAEVKRYAEECLAISQYDLQTRPVPQKSRGLRVGAVGRITYTALNYDRYWMSLIATLAEFSLFSGLGAGTTQGLGQCRRLPEPAMRSNLDN